MGKDLLVLQNVKKYFPVRNGMFSSSKGVVKAVDDVSLKIKEGETFGLVGESGCGKSTLSRVALKLVEPTDGKIIFDGKDITNFSRQQMRIQRKKASMIFQKPFTSLNPRQKVKDIIGAPFIVHGVCDKNQINKKVEELMDLVGLNRSYLNRYPHEFSGGQRQRIGIARAIALNPKLIVCDEPVSALDVSIQSQILNLLSDIQKEFKMTYMFISHNLSIVNYVADRIAVMYLGKIIELASASDIHDDPLHPYTKALLSAVPEIDIGFKKERIILKGDLPTPSNPPSGCRFSPRCEKANGICFEQSPKLKYLDGDRYVACHFCEKGGGK